MVDSFLLSLLQCPKCEKGSLEQTGEKELVCKHCQQSYLLKDNIPVLLVDEEE